MPTPATPDDAAAGEVQRRSFIPAEDFSALVGMLFGRPVPTETEQEPVRTWAFTPRVTREPGEDIPTLHFDPRLRPMYPYEELSPLDCNRRAAMEGFWASDPPPPAIYVTLPYANEQPRRVRDWQMTQRTNPPHYYSDLAGRSGYLPTRPPTTEIRFSIDLGEALPVDSWGLAQALARQFAGDHCRVLRSDLDGPILSVTAELVATLGNPAPQVGGALARILEPTPEQRATAAQWQRDREARAAQDRADREAAQTRATALLRSLLTPRQWRQYAETHTILVRGSDKRYYRIEHERVSNVIELDRAGKEVASWCAAPGGNLPIEDVMAAQLLWLRSDAEGFRAVANCSLVSELAVVGCTCALCRRAQQRLRRRPRNRRARPVTPVPEPPPTLRLTADPLPGMEPGRITRTLYDSDRVSGQWLVGGPTRWIYP